MKVSIVGLFADGATFENGILSLRGVRIEFSPSDRPHEDLLTTMKTPEEVTVKPSLVHPRVEEVVEDEITDEITFSKKVVDDTEVSQDEDDGGLMEMDLSE